MSDYEKVVTDFYVAVKNLKEALDGINGSIANLFSSPEKNPYDLLDLYDFMGASQASTIEVGTAGRAILDFAARGWGGINYDKR